MKTTFCSVLVGLLALSMGGCTGTPDVCADYPDKSCIALEVNGANLIDQVEISQLVGFALAPSNVAVSPPTPAEPFSLPVLVAILPGAQFSGGFSFVVRGLRANAAVGSANVAGSVPTPGAHVALSVTLATQDADGGGGDGGSDGGSDGGAAVPAPRPLRPMSTSIVTSRKPTFHWELAPGTDGAHVEICSDRACSTVLSQFDAQGSSGAPPANLLAKTVLYWRLRGRSGSSTGTAASPTWQFTTGALSAAVDTSHSTVLDVDGDGRSDVLVGAVCAPFTAGMCGVGQVYLYRGAAMWTQANLPAPTTIVEPNGVMGDQFGFNLASAGDVNGDGYSDVIIGNSPQGAGTRAAYVYLGGPSGLSATPASTLTETGAMQYARAIAGVGDVDGDGYGDVAVSATGVVYVYRGSATGLGPKPTAAWMLPQPTNSGGFGESIAGAGDVNGDGYADLAVGDSFIDFSFNGGVYVYLGGPVGGFVAGGNPNYASVLLGSGSEQRGRVVANAGDVNGDGYTDIVCSAPGGNSAMGLAYLFVGGASGVSAAQTATTLDLAVPTSGIQFGTTVAGIGDFDGDGYADLVVTAPGDAYGAANIYVGSSVRTKLGQTNTPWAKISPGSGANGDSFGMTIRGAIDINGDGQFDVAGGAPSYNNLEGREYVTFGTFVPPNVPSLYLPSPAGTTGVFGY